MRPAPPDATPPVATILADCPRCPAELGRLHLTHTAHAEGHLCSHLQTTARCAHCGTVYLLEVRLKAVDQVKQAWAKATRAIDQLADTPTAQLVTIANGGH